MEDLDPRLFAFYEPPKYTKRASVYRFGSRWHWKCGPRWAAPGLCLGGPARTLPAAYAAAAIHIYTEHQARPGWR